MSEEMSEEMNQEQNENNEQGENTAAKKNQKKAKDPFSETVKIKLPLIRGQGDVHVGVNGRFWQIQRGVSVDVPKPVYEVLQHQEEMELQAQAYEEALATKNAEMEKT